jgi:hypothetical protein
MTVRRLICLIGFTVVAAFASAPATAAPQIFLFDGTAPTNAITVHPGDSFTLTIKLTSDRAFYGFSAYLQDTSYTDTANFTITNRTLLATYPFQAVDENTDSTPDLTADPIDDLSADLGYTKGDATIAPGTWDLMTIRVFTSLAATAGSHTIQFDIGSVLADANFEPVYFDNLNATYAVTVVSPEPSLMGFVPLAAAMLRRRRKGSVR